jgi:hypothetical protein
MSKLIFVYIFQVLKTLKLLEFINLTFLSKLLRLSNVEPPILMSTYEHILNDCRN